MTSCRIKRNEKAELAAQELRDSAASVAEELAAHPENRRARLFADLFVRMMRDEAPAALLAARLSILEDVEVSRTEGLGYIASALWRRLIQLDSLDETRASALAEILCELIISPAVLFYFEHEARSSGLEVAAKILGTALDRRFPRFRRKSDRIAIDRELLESAGLDLAKLEADFHRSGHLRRLARRKAKEGSPALELEDPPGRGRYGETGRRGGYGFMVSERYEDGHAKGTFFSPWHDGEDYATKKPWLVWVLENASEIARG